MTLNENLLTRQIEDYIAYKRSLGYRFKGTELRSFAAFTRAVGYNGSLSSELVFQWASLNPNYTRLYMAKRLQTIHTFAKYISAFDSNAQIPQPGAFGASFYRTSPYIYSDKEISLLIAQARKMFPPNGIRAHTVSTAIGLLRATGLRVFELTLLKIKDVRLAEGYLCINNSKFKKDRIVPLHPTATQALACYRDFITEKLGQRDDHAYFFVNSCGRGLNTTAFEYAFRQIRTVLSTETACGGTRNIRLYDIRHTFACQTIKCWLETGMDVNQKLYLLSTYMGHVKPEDTYWYLSATPELLDISCKRYEAMFGRCHSSEGDPPDVNQRFDSEGGKEPK
jgi:site-specific recombinase XerD